MIEKLKSRKFQVALVGLLTGIIQLIVGNTQEGTATIIASVIGYLIAEGIIDAKAVKVTVDVIDEANEILESEDYDG